MNSKILLVNNKFKYILLIIETTVNKIVFLNTQYKV